MITGLNTLMAHLRDSDVNKRMWSSINEYPILFGLAAQYKIRTVFESGTCNGCSALTFVTAMALIGTHGKVYTWDIAAKPPVDSGTPYADRIIRHHASFAPGAIDVITKVEGGPRLFFIDGDHSRDGCLADIRTIEPVLGTGDVVVFHDYNFEWVQYALEEFQPPDYVIPSKQGIAVTVIK